MSSETSFAPLAAATGQPVNLAMQRLWLTGQVLPAGARLVVQHVFRSQENQPLEVIYCFPLPRDAALRSFRITGDGFEAHSELKPTAAAVKTYEEGINRGSLSTLVRQYKDGLVNLTVGNIRPQETITVCLEILCGVELRDDGFRFRFPFTLAPSYHAHAKTALVDVGVGEMELPATQFGDVILPRMHADPSRLHQVGFDLAIAGPLAIDEIASPSHSVRVRQQARSASIALAPEKDVPNRDLVFDVRFNSIEPQVLAGADKNGHRHFAAIVPSTSFGVLDESPRRIVILLDRSGSMEGDPLAQARKAIEACLGALSDADSFGLIAFSDGVSTFQRSLVSGSRRWRTKAGEFLAQISADGGTELACGFLAAAKLLGSEGGDILIITDGQVSGTETILAEARSAGVRLHCLGIGSASQDRFLTLLARETGGVSRFVTPRERVDIPAVDLFASMGRPIVSGLQSGENIQPPPPPHVFKGTPVLLFGESSDENSEAPIELTWTGGSLTLPVECGQTDIAETLRLLQGSRLITDWESRYASADTSAPLEQRKQNRVAARLLHLSQTYGLASREMSLVAVVTRKGDRAGELPETTIVPVGMPEGTAFHAYFRNHNVPLFSLASVGQRKVSRVDQAVPVPILEQFYFADVFGLPKPASGGHVKSPEDVLLDIASRLEADGGMPGNNPESRALASVIALLAFLSQGHTPSSGAFRSHVARLVAFLEAANGIPTHHQTTAAAAVARLVALLKASNSLPDRRQATVAAVLDLARKGQAPPGDWIAVAAKSNTDWKGVESVLSA